MNGETLKTSRAAGSQPEVIAAALNSAEVPAAQQLQRARVEELAGRRVEKLALLPVFPEVARALRVLPVEIGVRGALELLRGRVRALELAEIGLLERSLPGRRKGSQGRGPTRRKR